MIPFKQALLNTYNYLMQPIDYKFECQKRGVKLETLHQIKKLTIMYWVRYILALTIATIFILVLVDWHILSFFNYSNELANYQYISILFSVLSIFFFSKSAFREKYQIALESSTMYGNNDLVMRGLVKQKIEYAIGSIMLIISIYFQIRTLTSI